MISLKVVPEVSSIDGKDSQTVNGQLNQANIYAVRRIDTQVTIPSGNTLVMGGLIRDDNAKTYSKVPILGDIPGIGAAFRHENKTRNKSNLLIFITPTIVAEGDFQPTTTDFLRTRVVDRSASTDNWWDSARPKQWTSQRN
jgi:general secretion pathway protein D